MTRHQVSPEVGTAILFGLLQMVVALITIYQQRRLYRQINSK